MAGAYGEEVEQEVEAPEDDLDGEEAAFLHIGRYSEARRALPWEQWTLREKVGYYLDRIFLGFFLLFLFVMFAEFSYKMWYVTNVKKVVAFVSDSAAWLLGWLFAQEEREELIEL